MADLEGARFGALMVLSRGASNAEGRRLWLCTCDCGGTRLASTKSLRGGKMTSCASCVPNSAKAPLAARLRKWVESASGCWEWSGRRNALGYGRIIVDGVETRAHRAMFFMLNQSADRSLVVRHTCDNPSCVNPDHLLLGTVKDNMNDMHTRGRFRGGAKPGNRNAVGNQGWRKGGIVKMLGRV
jgi:hypothetical protein